MHARTHMHVHVYAKDMRLAFRAEGGEACDGVNFLGEFFLLSWIKPQDRSFYHRRNIYPYYGQFH